MGLGCGGGGGGAGSKCSLRGFQGGEGWRGGCVLTNKL